ncbi:tetratricopeptide repeat protein [Nocardia sp. NPDC020380]|uniref:caspase, EACC1-associated type n=1 Tax=Nocardia sp. NPDC020380 TaxID=3364309 RepID=UPI00379730F0
MTAAADRSGWRAVLIGVSRYTDTGVPDIPAAGNNVVDLASLLTSPTGAGLADDHCTVLVDPERNSQVGAALAGSAKSAEDVLLVYYTGHGLLDQQGRLYLALPDSNPDHPAWSSVRFETLREELIGSRARARILILDCCFSGRAFEAMSGQPSLVDGQLDIHGTYTIASSAGNEPSVAPDGDRNTAFTAALLSAATNADVTLDQLFVQIDEILCRKGRPRPRRRTVNAAGGLHLFAVPGVRRNPDGTVATTSDEARRQAELSYQRGQRCLDRGDLPEAERWWRQAAAQGHIVAMNTLANLLSEKGKATESRNWYRMAAEQGDVYAAMRLASASYEAQGFRDAEHWWRLAAETGNVDAMYNLAVVLEKGFRFDDALAWYRRAAKADCTDAMHNLAIRLRNLGQLPEAATWWRKAGHEQPQRNNEQPRGPHPWSR